MDAELSIMKRMSILSIPCCRTIAAGPNVHDDPLSPSPPVPPWVVPPHPKNAEPASAAKTNRFLMSLEHGHTGRDPSSERPSPVRATTRDGRRYRPVPPADVVHCM